MPITNTEALTRVIEHREIFHDEMLALMRRIMSGETPRCPNCRRDWSYSR